MPDIKIQISENAEKVIKTLEKSGFDSYIVGGCVRDSLIGKKPNDFDICTSAQPEEVKAAFEKTIDTGLKHGTVTVVMGGELFEVTTFRKDGTYTDGRRPDFVQFTPEIREDLSRRDFTVNAMAYHPERGLIDPFGGEKDILEKRIVCVGDAETRFQEDALRILRAMRFSSVLGYQIEKDTAQAMHRLKGNLSNVSAERIREELCKMLFGENVLSVLMEFSDIIAQIIPEMEPCIGFEQNNRYHQYTVYEHIAHAVANYKGNSVSIKVALLLHDIGKPLCYSEDERGGHFYGHGVPSEAIAREVVYRLRFDNKTAEEIAQLVKNHDQVLEPTPKVVKKAMSRMGQDIFEMLLDVRMADIHAHAEGTQESRIARCNQLREIYQQVLAEQECFSLKKLAVNGRDLMNIGYKEGKEIGETLNKLLDAVIGGEAENNKEALLKIAGKEL